MAVLAGRLSRRGLPRLRERRSSLVQFGDSLLHVGEDVVDVGHPFPVNEAAGPCWLRVLVAVLGSRCRSGVRFWWLRLVIRVDRQVAVGAEVTRREIPDPSGHGVRGCPRQRDRHVAPVVDRRERGALLVASARTARVADGRGVSVTAFAGWRALRFVRTDHGGRRRNHSWRSTSFCPTLWPATSCRLPHRSSVRRFRPRRARC